MTTWRRRALLYSPVALAGWLFADLLAAFAVVVMGSQITVPAADATSPGPSVTASARPSGSAAATPTRPPGIDQNYVEVALPDTSSAEGIRAALATQAGKLAGRRAGIVLTFGRGGSPAGERLAQAVNRQLPLVDPALFGSAVYRNFHTLSNTTTINIYLFLP